MGLDKNKYYNFFDICKMENIPEGTAKGAIGQGVNGISKIAKLKPIAHLFRIFPNGKRKQYGINKKHYDRWKETGEVPKVSPGRPKVYKEKPKDYRIPAPPFHLVFEAGLERINEGRIRKITKKEFIWLALKEAMERRPQYFDLNADWNDEDEQEEEC